MFDQRSPQAYVRDGNQAYVRDGNRLPWTIPLALNLYIDKLCTVQRLVRTKKQGGDERDPEVKQALIKFMMSERDTHICSSPTMGELLAIAVVYSPGCHNAVV